MEHTEDAANRDPITFNPKLVEALLRKHWQADTAGDHTTLSGLSQPAPAPPVKISPEAVQLCAEALRLFVKEAVDRAGEEASCSGDDMVEPSHVEQILAQLLLDF